MKQITHQPITLNDMLKLLKDEKRWGQRRKILWTTQGTAPSRGYQSLEHALLNWKETIESKDKNKPRLKENLEIMYRSLDRSNLSTKSLDNSVPE